MGGREGGREGLTSRWSEERREGGRVGGREGGAYQQLDRVFLVSDFNGAKAVFKTTLKSEAPTSRSAIVALEDKDSWVRGREGGRE